MKAVNSFRNEWRPASAISVETQIIPKMYSSRLRDDTAPLPRKPLTIVAIDMKLPYALSAVTVTLPNAMLKYSSAATAPVEPRPTMYATS